MALDMATLQQLKSSQKTAKNSRTTLNKRLDKLYTIRNKLENDFSNNISTIGTRCDNINGCLTNGLKGAGNNISALKQDVTGLKEKDVFRDEYMSSARGSITNEISRCQNEISSLNSEINNLGNQIDNFDEGNI